MGISLSLFCGAGAGRAFCGSGASIFKLPSGVKSDLTSFMSTSGGRLNFLENSWYTLEEVLPSSVLTSFFASIVTMWSLRLTFKSSGPILPPRGTLTVNFPGSVLSDAERRSVRDEDDEVKGSKGLSERLRRGKPKREAREAGSWKKFWSLLWKNGSLLPKRSSKGDTKKSRVILIWFLESNAQLSVTVVRKVVNSELWTVDCWWFRSSLSTKKLLVGCKG